MPKDDVGDFFNKNMKQIYLYGYYINYEDDARDGIYYLQYQIDPEEARVFFEQARLKGSCPFEDQYNRDFLLTYNYNDGSYTLTRKN